MPAVSSSSSSAKLAKLARTALATAIAASGVIAGSVFSAGTAQAATTGDSIVNTAAGQLGNAACGNGGRGYYASGTGQTNSCSGGQEAHAWCADFVGWVWARNGVQNLGVLNDLANSLQTYGNNNGTLGSTPHVGDAVFFHPSGYSTGYTTYDHVAIVSAVNSDGTIDWIGGNQGSSPGYVTRNTRMPGAVGSKEWSVNGVNVHLAGYIRPVGGQAAVQRGDLFHESRDPWGSWSGFAAVNGYAGAPSFNASQEAITSTPDKSTQTLAAGNDGNLYHTARYANGSWTGWAPLDGYDGAPNFSAKSFSIAGMPNGDAQVLAVGNDGGIYFTTRLVSGSWQGWSKVGDWSARKVAITAMPNGDAQILIIGNDGLVYHNIHFANGTWQGWNGVAGFGGAASFAANSISLAGMPNGDAQLVAVGNDGNIYHSIRLANGSWQGWGPVAGVGSAANFAASSIGITSTPNGDAQLVAVGNDGIAYHNARFASGSWQGWGSLGFGAVNVAITGVGDGSSQVLATHS
ncbi:CHAP domain-containing protein [Kitasatospora sp. NPDC059646]|uniref:CHAP domain-containing protein n=1 Tax=Kitasatospora sp. NPDC059646 TaxID=3346893 RepID=UPI00368207E0